MKALLITTGVLEFLTGMVLFGFASAVARMLFGAPLDAIGVEVGRVLGVALMSIGITCLLSRQAALSGARPLLRGLIVYNFVIVVVLIRAFSLGHVGIGLWPVAGAHVAMGVWCVTCLDARRPVAAPNP